MKVTSLPDAEPRPRKVAVGTFDGVHLGHREVIRGNDTVLTFDPHPLSVIAPQALPKLLDSPAIKRDLIAGLDVDELVSIPFDREFASKPAERFIEEVLIEKLGATHVSVGENFRFGKGAKGDPEMLRSYGEFETRVVALVEVEHETVSSTHIRGRELGFPTANVVPDDELAHPGHGVYAAWAHGQMAAVNVGVRPTFDTGRGLLVEAYLIDFDGDLYGETLRIAFARRLRGERRFESADALVKQMERDVEDARNVLLRFPADASDG